jgi:phage tail protein X
MNNQSTELQAVIYSYLTVNQFCNKHAAFKKGGIRAQIFNEHNNGLAESGAIVRVGSKVLINEPKYFAWIEGGVK